MQIPVTQINAAGGGSVLLSDLTLAVDTPSMNFSGLSQVYTHLRAVAMLRTDSANNDMYVRFNNDSSAIYDWQNSLFTNVPSVAQGAADTRITAGYVGFSTSPANEFGMYEIIFPYYVQTTSLKKSISQGSTRISDAANNFYTVIGQGTWRSTAAITQITFSAANNFVAGSRVMIYGLL